MNLQSNNPLRSTAIENLKSHRLSRRSLTKRQHDLPEELKKHDIDWSLIGWTSAALVGIGVFAVLSMLAILFFGPQY